MIEKLELHAGTIRLSKLQKVVIILLSGFILIFCCIIFLESYRYPCLPNVMWNDSSLSLSWVKRPMPGYYYQHERHVPPYAAHGEVAASSALEPPLSACHSTVVDDPSPKQHVNRARASTVFSTPFAHQGIILEDPSREQAMNGTSAVAASSVVEQPPFPCQGIILEDPSRKQDMNGASAVPSDGDVASSSAVERHRSTYQDTALDDPPRKQYMDGTSSVQSVLLPHRFVSCEPKLEQRPQTPRSSSHPSSGTPSPRSQQKDSQHQVAPKGTDVEADIDPTTAIG